MTSIARLSSVLVYASLCLLLSQSSSLAASTVAATPPPAAPQPATTVAAPTGDKEVPRGAHMPEQRVLPTGKLQMGVRGSSGRLLTGKEAGLPLSALPGAKFISSDEWQKMREIPKTGLFIVDADYVPANLPDALKEDGYSLDKNGTVVDRERKPRAIFILPQTYELSGKQSDRQGWLGRLRSFAGGFIGEARAGNPYWFACYSAQAWLVYSNGFCRYQDLKTKGWAWGPHAGGGCAWPLPATNISSIEVWAWIHGADFQDRTCANCSSKGVTATWNIGCFWPAYGSSSFENYANLHDNDPAHGNPRADAYWSWGH